MPFDETQTHKVCVKCGVERRINEFNWRKPGKLRRADCNVCKSEYNKQYRNNNLEKIKDYDKARYYEDPKRRYDELKRWRTISKDKMRVYAKRAKLKKCYKLTLDDFEIMLAAQGGRCAICGGTEPGGPTNLSFCVDHCHTTGRVRGLLCFSCNQGLGHFKDNVDLLANAAEYLQK